MGMHHTCDNLGFMTIPATFTQAYPVANVIVATPDNYLQYLCTQS